MTVDEGGGAALWVLKPERVQESIAALTGRRIHSFFVAYLHLRQVAARTGSLQNIQPVWTEVSEVLRIPDAPSDHPHFRPFWRTPNAGDRYWLNENIAGSYAPSSLRKNTLQVVSVGADGTFTLPEDHAQRALKHLLYGERLSATHLASFLLRDFGLFAQDDLSTTNLVETFREDYGVTNDAEFETLYEMRPEDPEYGWFELLPDGEGQ